MCLSDKGVFKGMVERAAVPLGISGN